MSPAFGHPCMIGQVRQDPSSQPRPGTDLPTAAELSPAVLVVGGLPPILPVPHPSVVRPEVDDRSALPLAWALEHVLAWVAATERDRLTLFPHGVADQYRRTFAVFPLRTEVRAALEDLLAMCERYASTPPLRVTHACLRLARHLCDRGARRSALAFAQAAAMASPTQARAVLEVGRLLGPEREEQARVWLHHALQLLEEVDEPALREDLHAELATIWYRRGDRRRARAHLLAALRAGRRGSVRAAAPTEA